MRINKFIAASTELSRRAADAAIEQGRVTINGALATTGSAVTQNDKVQLDGETVSPHETVLVLLHKPAGFVVSKDGQGSQTIYDILPAKYHHLNAVGRLDKDSSGLLLLTNDGHLAQKLTHPSNQKVKMYEVTLGTPLQPLHRQMITDYGVSLDDGVSKFTVERMSDSDDFNWKVIMKEGRNRQIRRTFWSLGYTVTRLHRTHFGPYELGQLPAGKIIEISDSF